MAAVGLLEGGSEGVDVGLIFFDDGLELRDLLLDREGFAGEGVAAERGLAKSEGEGLVDFVVGETLGFAGEGLLFGGDGEGSEGFDGLPGALVDESGGCPSLRVAPGGRAGASWRRGSTRLLRDRVRGGLLGSR